MSSNDSSKTSNENLSQWLSFFKFLLGSFVLGGITLVIDSNLKERQIENEETQLIGQYVTYALTKDVADRKRFSEYFSTVVRSEKNRERWRKYDSIVTIQYLQTKKELEIKDSLRKATMEERDLKKDEIIKGANEMNLTAQEKDEMIAIAVKDYDDKIAILELEVSDAQDKLEVKPISDLNSPKLTYDELKNDILAKIIVRFFNKYDNDCFNAARIKYFGQKKRNFRDLANFTVAQIEMRLEELYEFNIIEKGECRTKSLYSFSSKDNPKLKDFVN